MSHVMIRLAWTTVGTMLGLLWGLMGLVCWTQLTIMHYVTHSYYARWDAIWTEISQTKQQEGEDKEGGSCLSIGPVEELSGELQLINKESDMSCDMGREMGCGQMTDTQVEKAREDLQGESEMVTGLRKEQTVKIPGSDTEKGGASSSNWTEGYDLEKINF